MFKIKEPPFTVFGIVRFFKMNNFCLKIRFSQAQHSIFDFCFFCKDRCFFFLSNLFSSNTTSIFTRNETFCEDKRPLKVFGTMRLTGDQFFSKNLKKIFLNFLFFERFSVENDGFFCCFQLGRNGFRDLCVSLWVFFGAVKLMKL